MGDAMSVKPALSQRALLVHFFIEWTTLKRAYRFCNQSAIPSVIRPHCQMTAENVAERDSAVLEATFRYYG